MTPAAAYQVQPKDFDRVPHQRAAVDLNTTFLVEAGAGTGKTNVLVQRVLTVIRTGRSRLERVAAITFTEKAATELRIRLRTDVDALLAEALTDEERRHLRVARLHLERASISTVHAFCAALLRERPIEARVDPDFTVLDAFGAQLLQTETWQEWLSQQIDTGPDILKTALRAGLTLTHIEALRDFLLDNRDCLALLPHPHASPLPRFRPCFQQLAAQLAALRAACLNPQDRAYRHLLNILEKLPAGEEDHDWERLLFSELAIPKRVGNTANWQPGTFLDDVRRCLHQLSDVHTEARAVWVHNHVLELVVWLMGYLAHYAAKKQERACLDFSDLLLCTRNLLAQSLDVRRSFQHTFDFLLVDEFQDTDPLQAEIVFFLSEREPQAQTWTDVTLKPGKLFLVGDPHQSIYRFRRADMTVYNQVRARIERQGEVLALSKNFRTQEPILNWINQTFAQAFRHNTQDVLPYHPLQAGRQNEQAESAMGQQLIPLAIASDAKDSPLSREEIRRAEAQTVAAFLKRALSHSPPGSAPSASFTKEVPQIGYHDIAVLFRTHRAMDAYEEAFQAAGIPYRVFGGRQYISRPEIETLRLLLRCIERPSDRTMLVATLRSSVFGFSDAELSQFVSAGGQFSYTEIAIPATLASANRFRAAFALLSELHTRHAHSNPAALLYDIYNKTHLIPLFALRPHGAHHVANLLKLIDLARAVAAQGLQTLSAFNRLLDQHEHIGQEDEPVLDETHETGVRLMTIHKAKGLEFPVVILADAILSSGRSNRVGLIERHSDGEETPSSLELQLGPRALAWSTQGWKDALAREQEREVSEERRLWYVAATRVRDHLILPFLPKGADQAGLRNKSVWTAWQAGETTFPEAGDSSLRNQTYQDTSALSSMPTGTQGGLTTSLPLLPQFDQLKTDDTALRRYRRWEAERQALRNRGHQHRAVFSAADLATQAANQVDGPGAPPAQRQQPSARISQQPSLRPNLELGRAVAFALQTENWTKSQTTNHQRWTSQGEKETHRLVHNILSSPIIHRAKDAQHWFADYAFSLHYQRNLPNEQNETFDCLLDGVIEFAFLEHLLEKNVGDAAEQLVWTVVNFRAGSVARTDVHERAASYRPHLFLQALALEKLTSYPVKDCIVLFAHLPYEVNFSWDDTTRADAHALLADIPPVPAPPGHTLGQGTKRAPKRAQG